MDVYGNVIENTERQLSSASHDTSEFLLGYLNEYERRLPISPTRVGESYESP